MEPLCLGFIESSRKDNYHSFKNQPVGVLSLLTILEKEFGEKVKLSLIDLRGVEEENKLYYIPENDVFMYSITSPDWPEMSSIVNSLRSIYPKAKHIAGGPHATLFPEQSSKLFDGIAIGEGENIIKRIVTDVFMSDLKPIYKEDNLVDLNSYPYASRKFLPKTAVAVTETLDGDNAHLLGTMVMFSRGCPFNCRFCANLCPGPVRYRSPKLIEEELEYLKREYKIEALSLKDNNSIPVREKDAIPFLEAIGKAGIKWRGYSRSNGISLDTLKLAKDAGCDTIAMGIESVFPSVLKAINKKTNIKETKVHINNLKKVGINPRFFLMGGLPAEPEDIVKETLEFIDETEPSSVCFSLFCPIPGSDMYHNPQKYGIKYISKDWKRFRSVFGRFDENELPDLVFEYNDVTPWGKGKSKDKIISEYIELQSVFRDRKLNT